MKLVLFLIAAVAVCNAAEITKFPCYIQKTELNRKDGQSVAGVPLGVGNGVVVIANEKGREYNIPLNTLDADSISKLKQIHADMAQAKKIGGWLSLNRQEAHRPQIVRIMQTVPEGHLCQIEYPAHRNVTGTYGKRIWVNMKAKSDICLIEGLAGELADDTVFRTRLDVFPIGTHDYVSVIGAGKKVTKYTTSLSEFVNMAHPSGGATKPAGSLLDQDIPNMQGRILSARFYIAHPPKAAATVDDIRNRSNLTKQGGRKPGPTVLMDISAATKTALPKTSPPMILGQVAVKHPSGKLEKREVKWWPAGSREVESSSFARIQAKSLDISKTSYQRYRTTDDLTGCKVVAWHLILKTSDHLELHTSSYPASGALSGLGLGPQWWEK